MPVLRSLKNGRLALLQQPPEQRAERQCNRSGDRAEPDEMAVMLPIRHQFAWDEGEGNRSRAFWLDAHTNAFTRMLTAMGRDDEMHPDLPVVFERFELL